MPIPYKSIRFNDVVRALARILLRHKCRTTIFQNTQSSNYIMDNNDKNNSQPVMKSSKSLIILFFYYLVLFIVLFLLITVISYFLIKNFIKGNQVEVPNICGITTYEALEKLKPLKLYLQLDKRVFDDYYEQGFITMQYPLPKTRVKINSVINVNISTGSEYAIVPDVRNKDTISAGVMLRKTRLNMGDIAYYYSNDIPKDQIISQFPLPGGKEKLDRKVNLLISSGPEVEYYAMPQLKLKTLEEIKLILNTYGLVLGNINRNRNEQVEEGLIYEQLPPAGIKVARGEKISVTVSSGFYGSP